MIRAGNLTETVEIQRRSATLDAAGEQLNTWATIYTRRAELVQTPGREVYAAARVGARVPSVFRLRSGDLEVLPSDRIVSDGVVYGIGSVIPDGTDATLLVCEARVGESP